MKALSTAHVGPSTLTVVSASQDATLRVNAVHVDSTGHPHVTHVSNLVGHTASVDDCDINSSGTLVASAGWDTKIKLWQLPKPGETDNYVITEGDLGDDDEDDGPKRKKKRRIEPSSTPKPRPEVNRVRSLLIFPCPGESLTRWCSACGRFSGRTHWSCLRGALRIRNRARFCLLGSFYQVLGYP